jgi:hypothetical protein
MEVKILENFYFMGKLYKMNTTVKIEAEYHQLLSGKIMPIKQEVVSDATRKRKTRAKSK